MDGVQLPQGYSHFKEAVYFLPSSWKSMERWRVLIHTMITKQRVKNEQIQRKQICFVNVFKF